MSGSTLRGIRLTRNYLPHPEGSCLIEMGNTRIITTVSVEQTVPAWMKGKGSGWVTAEYGMLPRATQNRNRRSQAGGRAMEIQRLIGRSLRAVTSLDALGEHTITVDCDVLNADGGTRVASIIGAAVALHDAGTWLVDKGYIETHPMKELVAAISVGIVGGNLKVDLCYEEDSSADVDMNIVMTASGKLVEVQGTAEGATFDRGTLNDMLDAAEQAIAAIIEIQKDALGLT